MMDEWRFTTVLCICVTVFLLVKGCQDGLLESRRIELEELKIRGEKK